MNVVFFGSPEFAVPSLRALVGEGFATAGQVLGFVAFAAIGVGLYRWLLKRA